MDDAKKVLHQQVFNYLESAILDGHYKTNDIPNEVQIAKELEVSRTPVREAIMQLESIGLVSSAGGKGFAVSGISEKDLDDIYTIRIKIEGLAAKLSAKNITPDECSALEKIVDLQEFFLMKNKTDELWKLPEAKLFVLCFLLCTIMQNMPAIFPSAEKNGLLHQSRNTEKSFLPFKRVMEKRLNLKWSII